MLIHSPVLWVEGMRPVICDIGASSQGCWQGLNMSFGSTTLMTRAAGGGGGALSLLITLRQACKRGDFNIGV